MRIVLGPSDVPGWALYFKFKPFDLVICIPFLLVFSWTNENTHIFTHPDRCGITFSLDHLGATWKGEALFHWDFPAILFGHHVTVVVEELADEQTEKLYDGVWSGYPAIVGYRRKRLPFVTDKRRGFVLTMVRSKMTRKKDQTRILRNVSSLSKAIHQHRAADYLFKLMSSESSA